MSRFGWIASTLLVCSLLDVAVWAVAKWQGWGWPAPAVVIWHALLSSQLTFVGIWAALGGTRLPVRLAALPVTVGLMTWLERQVEHHFAWTLSFEVSTAILAAMAPLTLLRFVAGMHLIHADNSTLPESRPRQFTFAGAIWLMTVLAAYMALGRAARPTAFMWGEYVQWAATNAGFSLVAVWACWGGRWPLVRLPVFVSITIGVQLLGVWDLDFTRDWIGVLSLGGGLEAVLLAALLWTVRLAGYRLRRPSEREA